MSGWSDASVLALSARNYTASAVAAVTALERHTSDPRATAILVMARQLLAAVEVYMETLPKESK